MSGTITNSPIFPVELSNIPVNTPLGIVALDVNGNLPGGLPPGAITATEVITGLGFTPANSISLSSEITRATLAEGLLGTSITSEAATRLAVDTSLQISITTETTLRTTGDLALSSSIASETAARLAAEATIIAGLNFQSSGYNAATNTPSLNTAPANQTAYFVTTAGTPPTTVAGNSAGTLGSLSVGNIIFSNGSVIIALPGLYLPLSNPVAQGGVGVAGGITISSNTGDGSTLMIDPGGGLLTRFAPDGSIYSQGTAATFANVNFNQVSNLNGFAITDPGGAVGLIQTYGAVAATSTFSATDLLSSDVLALSESILVNTQNNVTGQRPTAQINVLGNYGQSEAQADQASPTQSVIPVNGNVMLGTDTRPLSQSGTTYTPVGGAVLTPLVSVNQNPTTGLAQVPSQGGMMSISGTIAVSTSPTNNITFTSCTGTLVTYMGGIETLTAVGGAGQPTFDLTQAFPAGELPQLFQTRGFTGGLGYINNNGISDMSRTIGTITPTSLTLTSGSNGFAVNGTTSGTISLYATNNGGSFGEDPNISTANELSQMSQLDSSANTPINFGVFNGAIAGQSVASLSKGTNYYSRFLAGAVAFASAGQAAYSLLAPASAICCPAIIYRQGNQDVVAGTTQAVYTTALTTLIQNLRMDFALAFGQNRPPFFLMDQITGPQLSNTDTLNDAIVMAQYNMALNPPVPDFYVIGPTYYRPTTGIHPTPNGQRWTGAMAAKVLRRILQGKGWKPMYPFRITCRGNTVRINYYMPVPPVQFRPAFKICQPIMFADGGHVITDAGGVNPITSVAIVGSATIDITTQRTIAYPGTIQYADGSTHGGLGNVFDSDAAVTPQTYQYQDFGGQMPVENVAAYTDPTGLTGLTFPSPIGLPFPLFNGCMAYNLPLVAG
jgi:hypothetical protein